MERKYPTKMFWFFVLINFLFHFSICRFQELSFVLSEFGKTTSAMAHPTIAIRAAKSSVDSQLLHPTAKPTAHHVSVVVVRKLLRAIGLKHTNNL